MTTQTIKANVVTGDRKFFPFTWTRKDTIFVGNTKIGYFYTSREDRNGSTVSLNNGRQTKGRNLEWCIEQAGPLLEAVSEEQTA